MESAIGAVAEGFVADLLLVDGNPAEDLGALAPERVLILKEGVVVKGAC